MTAITRRRDHLARHRRLLLGRALVITGARMVPIPGVDDLIASRLMHNTFMQLADEHGITLVDEAVPRLSAEPSSEKGLARVIAAGAAIRLVTRYWVRALVAFTTVRRAQALAQTFIRFTLFAHYCARLHVGGPITTHDADRLREAIDEALAETSGSIIWAPFRRGLVSAVRATVRAPLELADIVTRGWLARVRADAVVEPVAESDVERAIDEAIAKEDSFVGRATAAIETQLAAEHNPFLERVIAQFETRWRHRRP